MIYLRKATFTRKEVDLYVKKELNSLIADKADVEACNSVYIQIISGTKKFMTLGAVQGPLNIVRNMMYKENISLDRKTSAILGNFNKPKKDSVIVGNFNKRRINWYR